MPDATEETTADDEITLDLAVVRSLARLTEGNIAAFQQTTEPPEEVVRWLANADQSSVNGVLIHAVRRWCELGRQADEDRNATR